MTTREMIDLVCDEKIIERDYMPLPKDPQMTMETFTMDCGDYLLNLEPEELRKLRYNLHKVQWWQKYMLEGAKPERFVDWSGTLSNFCHEITGLLLKSLERSGISMDALEIDREAA